MERPGATGLARDALLNPNAPQSHSPGHPTATLAEVQAQVDGVRVVMQENVHTMLNNMDKASTLETTSSELAMQAFTHPRPKHTAPL